MSSALSSVPETQRRTSAYVSGGMAVLMAVIAVLPWLTDAPAAVRLFAVVAAFAAVLLGLVSWGLLHSLRSDAAEADLDATLSSAASAAGFGCTGCGHDHDLDEMTVTDHDADDAASRPQESAAAGCGASEAACAHDCAACVLSRA